jgi:flagellar assembly factor FliW
MIVQTTRFGKIDVKDQDLFEFREGLLGFGHLRKFIILDDPHDDIFAWLQSCESPDVAFPILEPGLFAPQLSVEFSSSDLEALELASAQAGKVFCIVTIPNDPTKMTANVKAPVLVNLANHRARQCVLQDNSLAIREPIFQSLQQRMLQSKSPAGAVATAASTASAAPEKPNPGPVQSQKETSESL